MPVNVVNMDEAAQFGRVNLSYDALIRDPAVVASAAFIPARVSAGTTAFPPSACADWVPSRTLTLLDGRRRVSGA